MSPKTTALDFSGQTFTVGLDTHKANWKVSIRNNGTALRTFSMPPVPAVLADHMNRNYPRGTYQTVYEAGFCGFWIHRQLTQLGFSNIIVNPSDVPTTNKERAGKSDKIDCRKLSRELENRSLRGIFVPTEHQESQRCLHRLYLQSSKRVTQLKNRIKGYLHFAGIEIPAEFAGRSWSNRFLTYLSHVELSQELHRYVLDDLLAELRHARSKKLLILRKIRDVSQTEEIICLLKTVPGVGPLTAFAIFAELVDINRFKNLDHLASYVGLVPSVQSSDEKITVQGISRRHCKYLRGPLIESAWVAIRHDPALLQAYNGLRNRKEPQEAIVRIAKKLLNRIRYVWKNKTEYVEAIVE